jgi:hypothetical protein
MKQSSRYNRLSHDKIEELKQSFQTPQKLSQTRYPQKLTGAAQLFNVEKSLEQYFLNESLGKVTRREGNITTLNESAMTSFDLPKKGISILTMVQNFENTSALK